MAVKVAEKTGLHPVLREALESKKCATVAAQAVVDATDLATVITLCNSNKVKLNAIITALKNADLMA